MAQRTFLATSGSRLVAGQTGFGMWQERCRALVKECARVRAVLHVGNLVELIQVGRYEGNSQGVASFLKGPIARGELLAIAECLPEQIPLIEREDPALLGLFEQIAVDEPPPEQAGAFSRGSRSGRPMAGLP